MTLDLLQLNIHSSYGNEMMGVIPLMPNLSTQFTGRTEAIAKLKSYFFTNRNDAVQKRKLFLLYGMGGIGKTQICEVLAVPSLFLQESGHSGGMKFSRRLC